VRDKLCEQGGQIDGIAMLLYLRLMQDMEAAEQHKIRCRRRI